jgi:hypothetical protein
MRFARKVALLVVGFLVAAGLSALVPATASADVPFGTAWTGSGTGGAVVSDGTASSPQFAYSLAHAQDLPHSWTFTTMATTAGVVTLPYDYFGFHSFFDVTVQLTAIVIHDGQTAPVPLVNDGPTTCLDGCTPPSGGFHYSGTTSFNVAVGDTYGWTFGGANFDSDDRMSGTFTVPVASFVDAATVAQNTSWTTAATLPANATGVDGTLVAPGEARWYKFPIVPSSQVQIDLSALSQNYDLTLYSDIGAAFTTLTTTTDLNKLGAEQVGNAYSPSVFSPSVFSPSVFSPSVFSPSVFSPSVYSPSVFSPSVFSPSVFSPSVFSPSVFSPSVFSPSVFSPSVFSPSQAFLQAFSDAQTRSLIGVSAQDGNAPESISAATYNNTGNFYVRVLGRNGASGASFHLTLGVTGGPCTGLTLNAHPELATLSGTPGTAKNVILTDSTRLTPTPALSTDLASLAAATNGVVVDVSKSPRVVALNAQADQAQFKSCPYAKNLVAQAIRDIVNTYRNSSNGLQYVTIIGGDSVIPFFRYADTAGLGPESGYVPPVLGTSASQASLSNNDVLGQDAYGAVSDLTLKGSVLPVPDLAVGRLVESAADIDGQIKQFLGLTNQTLPPPTSSLVTGYDFLTSAADNVEATLQAGVGGTHNDTLITNQGVPTTTVTGPSGPSRTTSWTATDLSNALFNSHHDIVFLAGHFSANSALAADYSTSLVTTDVAAHPNAFANTLVFSAGCHSGYNIVDGDGVPGLTLTLDWAQEMAQQKAILIAGTGYQYADTNFLAFSAQLYTFVADELRAGGAGTTIAIGQALVRAKQDYLDTLQTVSGIDQKTILEATMYGLPMTGMKMAGSRTAPPAASTVLTPQPVTSNPGATLGLLSKTVSIDTPTTSGPPVAALNLNGTPTGTSLTYLKGATGATVTQPAVPALPEQIVPATSSGGESLRGVGFRSGTYTDTAGVTPLTGAPTTEQNGIHTTFSSPSFFPQSLASVNYFDALGGSNSTNQTRLVVTPAQYRSDSLSALTDTLRAYSNLGLSLFYSSNTKTYGQNTPALAQAPSISQVSAIADSTGSTLAVSVHVTGDPSAGVQQVWITYTGETGPFHGSWASLDLTQSTGGDSTLWTGTLPLGGESASDVRFMVQAVNGVGVVGVDNNLGAEYTPTAPPVDPSQPPPPAPSATTLTPDAAASSVAIGANLTMGATLKLTGLGTPGPVGSVVTFAIAGQGSVSALTDASGHATATTRILASPGSYRWSASYAGDALDEPATSSSSPFTVIKAPTALVLSTNKKVFALGGAPKLPSLRLNSTGAVAPAQSTTLIPVFNIDTGLIATLTSNGQPLGQRSVLFTLKGLLFKQTVTATRTTDLNGNAFLGTIALVPDAYTLTVTFGVALPGTALDPSYAQSSSPAATVVLAPLLPITIVLPVKK